MEKDNQLLVDFYAYSLIYSITAHYRMGFTASFITDTAIVDYA